MKIIAKGRPRTALRRNPEPTGACPPLSHWKFRMVEYVALPLACFKE